MRSEWIPGLWGRPVRVPALSGGRNNQEARVTGSQSKRVESQVKNNWEGGGGGHVKKVRKVSPWEAPRGKKLMPPAGRQRGQGLQRRAGTAPYPEAQDRMPTSLARL